MRKVETPVGRVISVPRERDKKRWLKKIYHLVQTIRISLSEFHSCNELNIVMSESYNES